MKTILLSLLCCFLFQSLGAQKPEEILDNWSNKVPIEKIYLHFDRDQYIAGETAWFKAYLLSDYFPDTISTSVYVELLTDHSTVIQRKILPVFFGTAYGQLELPDTLANGNYLIRAWTTTMLNQDENFIYKKTINVYGRKIISTVQLNKESSLKMEFFPEGGNLVSGFMNTVAFKATDENGLPVTISGSIKNANGEIIETISSYHDGMGFFDLQPKMGENYYVTVNDHNQQFIIPEAIERGIVFKIMPDPGGKYFQLIQHSDDPEFQAAFMIGQMQHHTVFRHDFLPGKNNITGIIKTSNLYSGILQITVFNKDGMPLAERLCFIDNNNYLQPAQLTLDTLNFSERGKNIFNISFKDTVVGSLSVAITDPDYSSSSMEENIISNFLLTSDIRGYVHHPAWYFDHDDDSVRNALDLVMMTNGWRRFKWTQLLKNSLPPSNYKDAGYISLKGQIHLKDTRKAFAGKDFVVFITSADSTRNIQMGNTDESGYFKMDSMIFFDKSRLLFKDIRGKRSDLLEIKIAADSLTRPFYLSAIDPKFFPRSGFNDSTFSQKMAYDYNAILKADGLMLKGVVVRTKKKTPVQELEERYASGLFSGFSERTIDLVNTTEAIYQSNIFDYLTSRVPGLNIVKDGLDYQIYYRQNASLSSMGPIVMTLYLDEIETDASFIATIPANQIAMVKVFSTFIGASGGGPGGALAVFTKKGTDYINSSSSEDQLNYQGYSISKEFYSPDYSVTKVKGDADRRITLQWMPDIFVYGVDSKIPISFFNNDRTKSYKIVIQGMTSNGKLVHIEQLVENKKAF
jgi:hypothetical protein